MQNSITTITDLYDRTLGALDFPDISMSPVDIVEILIISCFGSKTHVHGICSREL